MSPAGRIALNVRKASFLLADAARLRRCADYHSVAVAYHVAAPSRALRWPPSATAMGSTWLTTADSLSQTVRGRVDLVTGPSLS